MRSSASSRPSPSAHPAPRRRRRHGRRLFCLTVLACCVAGCIAFALSQEPQTAASSAASQPAASSSDAENGLLTAAQAQALLDDPRMVLVNLRLGGLLLFGPDHLEIERGPAADPGHRQDEQERPHAAACFRLLRRFLGFRRLRGSAHAFSHIDRADGTICIDGPHHAFFRAGAHRLFHASGLGCGQQVGLVHHIQKIGFVLFALLVHGLVVVNDEIECSPAAGLDGDKLLVGVFVIEQVAGHKAALLRKALAGLYGRLRLRGRGFHCGIAVVLILTAPSIGGGAESA